MRYFVTIEGKEHVVDVSDVPGGSIEVRLSEAENGGPGRLLDVEVSHPGGPLTVRVEGHVFDLVLDGAAPNVTVFASGRRAAALVENAHQRAAASVRSGGKGGATGLVTSPMPGKVVKVLVAEGDEVQPGRPLIVVEAMKMENELVAEAPGTVQKVYVQPGDAVEGGARLISIV